MGTIVLWMKLKKIFLSTAILVLLLPLMFVAAGVAQERMVGVTMDDWFRYGGFTLNWSSNDPNATFPPGMPYLEELNETEWTLMTAQNIFHTTVYFQTVKHFKDGTEKTENGSIDIDSGTGNMTYMAISANLSTNDTVYTSSPGSAMKINETVARTYPDGIRETSHANTTREFNITRYIDSLPINGTAYEFVNYYWDRSTGAFVEYLYQEIEQVGDYTTTISASYRIIESSIWTVPEFPTWTSMLFVLTMLTVVIAIYKRRLLKTLVH